MRAEVAAIGQRCLESGEERRQPTGLARDASPAARLLWRTIAKAMLPLPGVNTPERSGADLARLVTDPALESTTGRHFVGRADRPSSAASYDRTTQRELFEDSAELLSELRRRSTEQTGAAFGVEGQ
ncbi:hypothetical protein [Nocardia arizonensis]|uniref:hypothetical protein n=1 Tax=Nocardia arizonensis TaxID=1141647 RepID=UPI0006D121CC|nr:hypothetical protein [Nocardia arizonensis]